MDQLSPRVGAGVVILRDGKTLLAKRKGSHGSGMWGSMGGHVEFGETPREAVIREAQEELGVTLENVRFVSCMSMMNEGKHYIDVSFVAELGACEPCIMEPDKIEELRWHAIDDLPEPLFPPVAIVLEALQSGRVYHERH